MSFQSEAVLVDVFTAVLAKDALLDCRSSALEFNYSGGRTDVVAVNQNGAVLSFEAKLFKWKDALHQAHRNTTFAHYSYVVLPSTAAQAALRSKEQFEKRGVGICTVDGSGVRVGLEARRHEPLKPWLTETATIFVHDCDYPSL